MGPPSTKGHGMMTPAGYIPKQEMGSPPTREMQTLEAEEWKSDKW